MAKKVTIKGRGPELFGRGIDLLFGDAGDNGAQQPAAGTNGTARRPAGVDLVSVAASPAREAAYLDVSDAGQLWPGPVDEYLRLAAEVFFSMQNTLLASNGTAGYATLPTHIPSGDDASPHIVELASAATAVTQRDLQPGSEVSIPAVEPPYEQPAAEPAPAMLAQQDHEGTIMPTPQRDDSIDMTGASQEAQPPGDVQARQVGVPSSNGSAGADDSALSPDIAKKETTSLTKQEAKEVMGKLRRSDLSALDREVDALYGKVSTLLSGRREEATIAFDILRRVRLILLKDPEQYADAEYMVNQVRARVNQIEQSLEGGRSYAPRIFAYQTIWVVVLAILALITTVNGTTFSAWVAYLLGVEMNSPQLSWAVLFLSTLAWGGIGGVTSALWSLHHHISVARDYDPVENLWYYSQPVLGMVLGGIVFLVLGAGFLVVQVDLASQDAALGARLLPAAIAVVAGFRQSMVLELIERVVSLIIPSQAKESPALQPVSQQPTQQPSEELVI
jgi:hypothetical protein